MTEVFLLMTFRRGPNLSKLKDMSPFKGKTAGTFRAGDPGSVSFHGTNNIALPPAFAPGAGVRVDF